MVKKYIFYEGIFLEIYIFRNIFLLKLLYSYLLFFVLLQIVISRIKVVEPFGENGSVGDIFHEVTSTSGRQFMVEQPQAVMCVK